MKPSTLAAGAALVVALACVPARTPAPVAATAPTPAPTSAATAAVTARVDEAPPAPAPAPFPCPVTSPNGSAPPGEKPSGSHHGNGELWTALWPEGSVVFRPGGPGAIGADGSLEMKWPWWGAVPGQLTIEGRRLDGPAPSLEARVPQEYGFPGFWSTALRFPSEGCWEVTGRAGGAALTFVVRAVRVVAEPTTVAVGAPDPPAVRSSPTAIPPTTGSWGTLSAGDAREVATVVAYLDAYNAGRLDEALALLDDRPAYYDCDYTGQGFTAVATAAMAGGRQAVATWLRARFADHDRLLLESLGVGPDTRAVAVRIQRRTSDSLRRLGFAAGAAPQATGKWVVTPSGGAPAQRAVITQVMLAGKVDDCTRL